MQISGLPIEKAIFEVSQLDPAFRHHVLRRFVLSGCCGRLLDRLELVKYIVYNCVALKEIVIGVCDRLQSVRSIVDYGVPLHEIISWYPFRSYMGTVEHNRLLKKKPCDCNNFCPH